MYTAIKTTEHIKISKDMNSYFKKRKHKWLKKVWKDAQPKFLRTIQSDITIRYCKKLFKNDKSHHMEYCLWTAIKEIVLLCRWKCKLAQVFWKTRWHANNVGDVLNNQQLTFGRVFDVFVCRLVEECSQQYSFVRAKTWTLRKYLLMRKKKKSDMGYCTAVKTNALQLDKQQGGEEVESVHVNPFK